MLGNPRPRPGPSRPMSTEEIKTAFGRGRPSSKRQQSVQWFEIAEDVSQAPTQLEDKTQQQEVIGATSRLLSIVGTTSQSDCIQETIGRLRKDVRRKTVFKGNTTPHHEISSKIDTMIENPKPRKSPRISLLKPPKRMPLKNNMGTAQVPNFTIDRPGNPTGKENIPPGILNEISNAKVAPLSKKRVPEICAASNVVAPSVARDISTGMASAPDIAPVQCSRGKAQPTSASQACEHASIRLEKTPARPAVVETMNEKVSTRTSTKRKYPVTTEDIQDMRRYNDNWLSNQEIVLTEIINRVFDTVKNNPGATPTELRKRLNSLYGDIDLRRIKSSIGHGALALHGEDIIAKASVYLNSIDIRQKFINLWTDAYRPILLRAALEVVTARQLPDHSHVSLQAFIESCLMRNEDIDTETKDLEFGTKREADWSWKRTMLRSLAIILLLDKAKQSGIIRSNLLRRTSKYKSSQAVLEELSIVLRGSSMDVVRSLKLLGYRVMYTQDTRLEYDYRVTNIATDFRDGTRLARLTELMGGTTSSELDFTKDRREPSETLLSLTSKLKFHALGKPPKIKNVQIVLNYLNQIPHAEHVSRYTNAIDIVEGHQEATVFLLWAVVSQSAIGQLIEWKDLYSEVGRLDDEAKNSSEICKFGLWNLAESNIAIRYEAIKLWTRLLANKHGITVNNFSSSFSTEPSPFTAIIKEYLPYISASPLSADTALAGSLQQQLKQIGCGATFSKLFDHSNIFDENFVLTVLAFLASRVLGASKVNRNKRAFLKNLAEDCARVVRGRNQEESAAKTIQRVWKGYAARKEARRQSNDQRTASKKEEDSHGKDELSDLWLV